MGQQQLLLVILVTIIVGIATVVAINVFGTSAESANRDAVRQDILTIAAASQGWYIKPDMMGGGGNSFAGMTFRDVNFSAEGINANGDVAVNMNGRYTINTVPGTAGQQTFTVTADPSSDASYTPGLTGTAASEQMQALICKDGIAWAEGGTLPSDCDPATT